MRKRKSPRKGGARDTGKNIQRPTSNIEQPMECPTTMIFGVGCSMLDVRILKSFEPFEPLGGGYEQWDVY
jgi:hypothetical protein